MALASLFGLNTKITEIATLKETIRTLQEDLADQKESYAQLEYRHQELLKYSSEVNSVINSCTEVLLDEYKAPALRSLYHFNVCTLGSLSPKTRKLLEDHPAVLASLNSLLREYPGVFRAGRLDISSLTYVTLCRHLNGVDLTASQRQAVIQDFIRTCREVDCIDASGRSGQVVLRSGRLPAKLQDVLLSLLNRNKELTSVNKKLRGVKKQLSKAAKKSSSS